nr:hypothetical protein [Escherichia coli]
MSGKPAARQGDMTQYGGSIVQGFAESGMYPWRTLYQPGNNAGNGV